jgi:nitrogen fixation/metabolism regulation signal transduction histidine kinase
MGLILLIFILISSSVLFSFYYGLKKVIYDEFSTKNLLTKLKDIDRIAGYEEMRQRYQHTSPGNIEDTKMTKEANMLSRKQEELLNSFLKKMLRETFSYLSILLIIITIGTMFATHKIAGPIYRIKMLLKEAEAGNFNINFKLRSGDRLQDLANCLNNLFDKYRISLKELSSSVSELEIKCRILEEKTNDQNTKKEILNLKNKIKQITQICHKLSGETL